MKMQRLSVVGAVHRLLRDVPRSLADGQYFALAGGIEAVLARVSRNPAHIHRRCLYTRLAKVKSEIRSGTNATQQYPVFVINREQNRDRLEILSRRCAYMGIDFIRVPAVDTMESDFDFKPYKQFIPDAFWGTSSFKRGAVGCYLSHAKLWEYICQQHVDFCMILEDDAYPLVPFPKVASSFNLPDQFDLIFVNARAGSDLAAATYAPMTDEPFNYHSYQEVVRSVVESDRVRAPGSDGYAISQRGAKKLLQMVAETKVCCGLDWAIALHAMADSFREWFIESSDEKKKKALLTARIGDVRLDAFVLQPCLVDHRPTSSTVDHMNPARWIERSAMGI
jgi:glycosyl transferase family 25